MTTLRPVTRATTLHGRSHLLRDLHERTAQGVGQPVVLIGPGGVGKTALALQWARERQALVVEVASATSLRDLLQALSRGLDTSIAHLDHDEDAARHLGTAWRAAQRPLLIDNVEQVLDPVRALVDAWFEADTPPALVLTSRIPLSLPHEHVLEVPALAADAGRMLFRARTGDDSTHEDVLTDLVTLLGGNPLAIELAAAQHSLMTPAQSLQRLRVRYDLADARRHPRHRSLDACIQWSWDLLDDDARDALSALCAFAGSFHAADAEAVIGTQGLSRLLVLQRASLLRTQRDDSGIRMEPYDSVRTFVLAHAPPPLAARQRHADHVLAHIRGVTDRHGTEGWSHDLPVLQRWIPEFLRVLSWLGPSEPARTISALMAVPVLRGSVITSQEARTIFAQHLPPDSALTPALHAHLHSEYALILQRCGAAQAAAQVVDRARATATGDDRVLLYATHADLLYRRGLAAEACEVLDEADALMTPQTPIATRLQVLRRQGVARRMESDNDRAVASLEAAISLALASGDLATAGLCMQQLGMIYSLPWTTCKLHLDRAMDVLSRLGPDVVYERALLCNVAIAHTYRGDPHEALAYSLQARSFAQLHGSAVDVMLVQACVAILRPVLEPSSPELLLDLTWFDQLALQTGNRRTLAKNDLARAILATRSGDPEAAEVHLTRAWDLYAETSFHMGLETIHLCRVALAVRRGDARGAAQHAAHLTLPGHTHAARILMEGKPLTPQTLCVEFRLEHRIASALQDLHVPSAHVMTIGPACSWIALGHDRIDLSRRHASRRIMAALVAAHQDQEAVCTDALIAAGWPNERILPDAARMRLHTTIRSLRTLGFEPWLQTREGGYRLDPTLSVRR